jgi:hypothetical protein
MEMEMAMVMAWVMGKERAMVMARVMVQGLMTDYHSS